MIHHIVRAAAALPGATVVVFYSFVLGFRFHLGYWPTYGHPDAGAFTGGILIIDRMIFLLLLYAALSPLFVLAVFFGRVGSPSGRTVAAFGISWLVLIGLFQLDPGDFFHWYLD